MIWYQLEKAPKRATRTIFENFSVFWGILVEVKLLHLITEPIGRIGLNELCPLWKGGKFCGEIFLCFKRSLIGCIKFQMVHAEPFLTNFQIFEEFQYRSNFDFLGPKLLAELAQMKCAWSGKVSNFVEKCACTWNKLLSVARISKKCTPNHFWQIFSFLRNFSIGETFTSYDQTYCLNWLKLTLIPFKGWPIS